MTTKSDNNCEQCYKKKNDESEMLASIERVTETRVEMSSRTLYKCRVISQYQFLFSYVKPAIGVQNLYYGCSAAPPSFRLCCLNCAQRFDLITARSAVVGSWEEPPNI